MFSWEAFWASFPVLAPGLAVTLELTALAMAGAVVVALALAFARLAPVRSLRIAATWWVDVWRATPLLLQLYWLYYVLPAEFGVRLAGFWVVLFGLIANVSAFLSEIFRAGIASIRQGQWNAALALGMSRRQAFVRVIAPQAFFRVLPASANMWVELFKETSLVSTVAVADLTYRALALRTANYRTLEVLSALALTYLVLAYPQAKLADWLYAKVRVSE